MNRTVPIVAIAALGLISGGPARAQEATSATTPTSLEGPPADLEGAAKAPVKHALVATFFDQGTSGGGLPKGNTTYSFANATPITCAAACTIEVEIMLQIGQNTTKANKWAICADADKSSKLFSCPFQGTLPTDKTFVTGNWAYSASLAKGPHTLQPTVFVAAGAASLGTYHISYRVYQP